MKLATRLWQIRRNAKAFARAQLAVAWRPFLNRVTFIAVTGSCGKTTTVSLIGALLTENYQISIGVRYNTMQAANRTLLRTRPWHRACVQEVSGHAPGVIKPQMALLRPRIGIVTLVGSDHLKAFRSADAIAGEKAELVGGLPADGLAILNADDARVFAMRSETQARVITFGRTSSANYRATEICHAWPRPLGFTIRWQDQSVRVESQLFGEFWVTSILAAFACAVELGVPAQDAARCIGAFQPVFARHSIRRIDGGPVFVVDTTKAPLASFDASIEFLASARAPRKTLVLGNIADYAGKGKTQYRRVARAALEIGARVVGIGANASTIRYLQDAYPDGGISTFASSREARDYLMQDTLQDELILLKSAASGHIERVALNWFSGDDRCWVENCGRKYCASCPFLSDPVPVPPPDPRRRAGNPVPS